MCVVGEFFWTSEYTSRMCVREGPSKKTTKPPVVCWCVRKRNSKILSNATVGDLSSKNPKKARRLTHVRMCVLVVFLFLFLKTTLTQSTCVCVKEVLKHVELYRMAGERVLKSSTKTHMWVGGPFF